jgi:bifunctional NMN adenylyltransferase/nudix hydrolase
MASASNSDLAVLIGRFQPFHWGHAGLLNKALELAPRALVIVGSAHGPRLVKNPFTAEERIDQIRGSLDADARARVSFATVRDYYDEPRWAAAVEAAVKREAGAGRVTLVGFRKDDSSSYLSLFPQWREYAAPRQAPIDGTALRRLYFTGGAELPPELVQAVPPVIAQFLSQFRATAEFERLREELASLDQSRASYGDGPFVTVDAVVTVGDRLLLIQRGRPPGKGLWALPGGFLDGSERLLTAAIRELKEETVMACSDAELRRCLRDVAVFDHPQRSQRGRTITHAHYFVLEPHETAEASKTSDTTQPPSVEGADDAQAARWVKIADLPSMANELFEDHFQIIDHFLKLPEPRQG